MNLRRSLNHILRPFGYVLSKRDYLAEALEKIIQVKGNLRFLQIGGNDGVSFDSLYHFVTANPVSGVVVEPVGIYYTKLKHSYHYYPEIETIQVAVHACQKEIDIYHVNPEFINKDNAWAAGIGSIDPQHHLKSGIPSEQIIKETVPCVGLMELIEEKDLFAMDYLQIDTEGYDLEILNNLDFKVCKPSIIKFESRLIDQRSLESYKCNLHREGYKTREIKNDMLCILS